MNSFGRKRTADATEADLAGERMVVDGAHDAGEIIDDDESEECIEQTVTAAKEISQPATDASEYDLDGVPEFFHD